MMNPAPGPKDYGKYPVRPGPRYDYYGEQERLGYFYDPYTDTYQRNKVEQQKYYEEIGLVPKQPREPSLMQQIAPLAGLAMIKPAGEFVFDAAIKPAYEAGKKGLLGLWKDDAPAVQQATPTQTQGLQVSKENDAGGLLKWWNDTKPTPVAQNADGSVAMSDGSTIQPVGTAANGGTMMSDGSVMNPDGTIQDSSGVNLGRVGQGALGAYQGYQGYQQWKSGDKLGGGVNMTAGATNIAAAAGSQMAKKIAPGLNVVAGAYGMYDTLKGDVRTRNFKSVGSKVVEGAASGASMGAGIDVMTGGVTMGLGAAIGAIVGGTIGLVRGLWKSGKHKDQSRRDAYRRGLEELGIADRSGKGGGHAFVLSDGTKFDIGRDGGYRRENGCALYEMSEEEMRDPKYAFTQAALMPIAQAMGGEEGNVGAEGQTSVMLTHGILSTGHDPATEIRSIYARALGVDPSEVTPENINGWIGEHYEEWGIDVDTARSYQNAINYWLDPNYDRGATDETFAQYADQYFKDNPLNGEKKDEEEQKDGQ